MLFRMQSNMLFRLFPLLTAQAGFAPVDICLISENCYNVAFQCKRYSGVVGASFVRDFRGSLTTDIEKGVLITTGTFSKSAKEEASNPGKQQIDLIDGEELIDKIAEYGIGVREVKTYEVDEDFFKSI